MHWKLAVYIKNLVLYFKLQYFIKYHLQTASHPIPYKPTPSADFISSSYCPPSLSMKLTADLSTKYFLVPLLESLLATAHPIQFWEYIVLE